MAVALWGVGSEFPVYVVEESCDAPEVGVLVEEFGEVAHSGFDGVCVVNVGLFFVVFA